MFLFVYNYTVIQNAQKSKSLYLFYYNIVLSFIHFTITYKNVLKNKAYVKAYSKNRPE